MSPRKKLIVTGANGFVAGSILAQGADAWEIHAVSRGTGPDPQGEWKAHSLDSLARDPWAELFRDVRPAAVIHTAALADIDYCEAHPDLARDVNFGLTRTLANLCAEHGARLVHCSTDTIFDGEHAPYREQDPPGPVNVYAHTKVAAEHAVLDASAGHVVARLAVIVGLPVLGVGNSFVARMLASLEAGRVVTVPEAEIRTPIDVVTLGKALMELASNEATSGVFHLAGNDRLNRLELARRIAVFFGHDPAGVVGIDPTTLPGRAARPRDVSMDNAKARAHLGTPMVGLDAALTSIRQTSQRRRP